MLYKRTSYRILKLYFAIWLRRNIDNFWKQRDDSHVQFAFVAIHYRRAKRNIFFFYAICRISRFDVLDDWKIYLNNFRLDLTSEYSFEEFTRENTATSIFSSSFLKTNGTSSTLVIAEPTPEIPPLIESTAQSELSETLAAVGRPSEPALRPKKAAPSRLSSNGDSWKKSQIWIWSFHLIATDLMI